MKLLSYLQCRRDVDDKNVLPWYSKLIFDVIPNGMKCQNEEVSTFCSFFSQNCLFITLLSRDFEQLFAFSRYLSPSAGVLWNQIQFPLEIIHLIVLFRKKQKTHCDHFSCSSFYHCCFGKKRFFCVSKRWPWQIVGDFLM